MKTRERQILEMISKGYTTKEMSSNLMLSYETIKTYRAHLLEKMQDRNVAHLVYVAMREGYLKNLTLIATRSQK